MNNAQMIDTNLMDNKIDWRTRAMKAEARVEALELAILYAKDVIAMWPRFTLRTIGQMTSLINTMNQAINRAQS